MSSASSSSCSDSPTGELDCRSRSGWELLMETRGDGDLDPGDTLGEGDLGDSGSESE